MYNNHMNNDQQNTNQQPPVSQTTPTMQPIPNQPPQVTPTEQPIPSQPPQTTNQQSQANQTYNQHDDAVERDFVYTNEHDLNVHIARSFAIMILGLFLLIVIGSATGLLSKHYGVFVLVNIYIPFSGIVLFAMKSTRIGRVKLMRDVSLSMFFGDIVVFIRAISVGNIVRSSPGSTRPLYYLLHPPLRTLPINEVIEASFVYLLIIAIFGVTYLVARAMYKKERGQNRS